MCAFSYTQENPSTILLEKNKCFDVQTRTLKNKIKWSITTKPLH